MKKDTRSGCICGALSKAFDATTFGNFLFGLCFIEIFLNISVQKQDFDWIFYLKKIINLPKMTQFFGRYVVLRRPQSLSLSIYIHLLVFWFGFARIRR